MRLFGFDPRPCRVGGGRMRALMLKLCILSAGLAPLTLACRQDGKDQASAESATLPGGVDSCERIVKNNVSPANRETHARAICTGYTTSPFNSCVAVVVYARDADAQAPEAIQSLCARVSGLTIAAARTANGCIQSKLAQDATLALGTAGELCLGHPRSVKAGVN